MEECSLTIESVQDTEGQINEPSSENRKTESNDPKNKNNGDQRILEERHFLRLYTLVLNDIISAKGVSEERIEKSIIRISNSFNPPGRVRFQFDKIDLSEWENVCGYLYRYGSHGAGFARFRILNALQNCKELNLLQEISDLRFVCLGGGPGNDAIGLCSALADWKCPKNLTITVVDKFVTWRSCVERTKELIGKESFGNVSELFKESKVKISYAVVELPGNPSDTKYFNALEGADVIQITKLLNILDFNTCREIIQNLKTEMKQGAFIFLTDPYLEFLWKDFEVIYTFGTNKCDIYQSSAQAEPRFYAEDNLSSGIEIRILRKKPTTPNQVDFQVEN